MFLIFTYSLLHFVLNYLIYSFYYYLLSFNIFYNTVVWTSSLTKIHVCPEIFLAGPDCSANTKKDLGVHPRTLIEMTNDDLIPRKSIEWKADLLITSFLPPPNGS